MKVARVIALALVVPAPGLVGAEAAPRSPTEKPKAVAPALDFTVKDIDGKDVHLGTYQGKVLLVVNVASQCGLTERQYPRLQALYEKYRKRGLEILAFPANNFGNQEPGSDGEIKAFCAKRKVSFKLFSKISVKGDDIHPFYKHLTSKETAGKFAGEIRWNFQKFLLDRDGRIAARFEPAADPLSKEVTDAIEKALGRAPDLAEGEKRAEES